MLAESNGRGVSFDCILRAELDDINRRRKMQRRRPLIANAPFSVGNHIVGLALSGGGIRAAALALGAIQALSSATHGDIEAERARSNLFEKLDYVSSVSGGSYAACSIAGRIIREGVKSPLSSTDDPGGIGFLSFVRTNAKLLDNYGEILINWLYGLVTGIVIISPFLLMLAGLQVGIFQDDLKLNVLVRSYEWFFQLFAVVGAVAYLSFAVVLSWFPGLLSGAVAVWRLLAAVGLLGFFVGLQPILIITNLPGGKAYNFFSSLAFLRLIQSVGLQEMAIPSAIFLAVASILVILFLERERFLRKQNTTNRSIIYRVGIQISLFIILIVGPMFLWSIVLMLSRWGVTCGGCPTATAHHYSPEIVFTAAKTLNDSFMPLYRTLGMARSFNEFAGILPAVSYSVLYVLVAVCLFIFMKYVIDTNKSSFHRYYRERIKSCFFEYAPELKAAKSDWRVKGTPRLSLLRDFSSPYLLVNCTLNAKTKIDGKVKRADEPFVVGSCYTGSEFVGYARTEYFERAIGRDFDLATIAAISGAAFSPVMGNFTVSSFRLLMSVLALRLGYWIPSPREMTGPKRARLFWPLADVPGRRVDGIYFLREMFGWLNARSRFLYITDGGHTDNSGIFELLRRRCTTIIAIDAEADPERLFDNIVYLIELARSRLNVEIALTCRTVGVEGGTHCAIGEINYPPSDDLPEVSGRLVYCKLSLTGDENWDLLCRRRASGEFPYHSTINQNYDELLFNAYRVLGTHILGRIFSGADRVEFLNGEVRCLSPDEIQGLFCG